MAPDCSAGRLSLCSVFTMCLVICLFCRGVSSLLADDRHTLLEIGGFYYQLKYQLKYDPLVNDVSSSAAALEVSLEPDL